MSFGCDRPVKCKIRSPKWGHLSLDLFAKLAFELSNGKILSKQIIFVATYTYLNFVLRVNSGTDILNFCARMFLSFLILYFISN